MDLMDGIKLVPFETPLVQFADRIINKRIELGRPIEITTDKHWDLVYFIFTGWNALYPEYSNAFLAHMRQWRRESNRHGISYEKGGARIQHQLEIPQSFYALIKIAFPNQTWDRKFCLKFAQRLPALKGSDTL